MRDPDRLSSSNGISDFERGLLDAGKNESMPAALREQMERALGFTGAAAGVPVRARVEAATGVKASAMVWISAGVVVLGVVGGIVGARLGSRLFPPRAPVTAPVPSEQPAAAAAVVPSVASPVSAAPVERDLAPAARVSTPPSTPARRTLALASSSRSRAHGASRSGIAHGARHGHGAALASASSPASAVSPAVPAEVAAPVASSAPADESVPAAPVRAVATRSTSAISEPRKASEPPVPSGDLRAEIDLIDGARAALRAGETSEALDLLGRHAVHFPHGALAPEETALRVEALMRLGRTAEARAYARRFVAANPASPLAERMRRLVNGATAP